MAYVTTGAGAMILPFSHPVNLSTPAQVRIFDMERGFPVDGNDHGNDYEQVGGCSALLRHCVHLALVKQMELMHTRLALGAGLDSTDHGVYEPRALDGWHCAHNTLPRHEWHHSPFVRGGQAWGACCRGHRRRGVPPNTIVGVDIDLSDCGHAVCVRHRRHRRALRRPRKDARGLGQLYCKSFKPMPLFALRVWSPCD
jgi:hypothetical protein